MESLDWLPRGFLGISGGSRPRRKHHNVFAVAGKYRESHEGP